MMKRHGMTIAGGIGVLLTGLCSCDWPGQVAGFQPDPVEEWRLASVSPGDYWSYSYDGELRTPNGPVAYVGGYTYTAWNDTVTDLVGQEAWMIYIVKISGHVDEEPLTTQEMMYWSQDADGSLWNHGGAHESDDASMQPYFVLAGQGGSFSRDSNPVAVGATATWDVTFDDGVHQTGTATVAAHEELTTALGTFQVARIEGTMTVNNGEERYSVTRTYTQWVSPDMVMPIRETAVDAFTFSLGTYEVAERLELTASSRLNARP